MTNDKAAALARVLSLGPVTPVLVINDVADAVPLGASAARRLVTAV